MPSSEKKKEDWMNSKWRPMMGWMYMMICLFDFMIAPVLWSLMQAFFHGGVTTQWQPLTLQGAGLFHLAMGAVLGIAAYGRTQEKLNGAEAGGVGSFGQGAGTTYVPPNATTMNNINQGNQSAGGFGAPAAGGFGSPPASGGFGSGFTSGFGASPAPQAPVVEQVNVTNVTTDVQLNSKGKKIVPKADQPEL
jgi:hypothetical protein